jgi:hypothetical protein
VNYKLLKSTAALLLAGTLAAMAQQPGGVRPEEAPQGADAGMQSGSDVPPAINAQQRQRIRAFVIEQRVAPATISGNVAVGAPLPAGVTVSAVPPALVADVPTVRNYGYVYWNDRVVLVEPSSRRVVHIID